MRQTKVSVSVGLTINTGNYNKMSAEADLQEGEDPAAAHLALTGMVKERVKAQVQSVIGMSRDASRGG